MYDIHLHFIILCCYEFFCYDYLVSLLTNYIDLNSIYRELILFQGSKGDINKYLLWEAGIGSGSARSH